MSPEVLKVVHDSLLILHEGMYVLIIFGYTSLINIVIRYVNLLLEEIEKHICISSMDRLESILTLGWWSEEALHFGGSTQIWVGADLSQELIQEELSLSYKHLLSMTSGLLWWKWRNEDSRVS